MTSLLRLLINESADPFVLVDGSWYFRFITRLYAGLLEAGIKSWILLDGLLAVHWESCKVSFSWWSRRLSIPTSWGAFAYDILGKMHERAILWTL